MRVLKGVAHVTDLQRVAKFSFAKDQFLLSTNSVSEQF